MWFHPSHIKCQSTASLNTNNNSSWNIRIERNWLKLSPVSQHYSLPMSSSFTILHIYSAETDQHNVSPKGDVTLLARHAVLPWSYNYTGGGMTTSPGSHGWTCLQAHSWVLQTTTTDDREQNNNTGPYTMCRRASNKPVPETRSSATSEGPHDALCQLKSCQLLHNCTKNHIWKGLQKVNDLEGHFLLMLCSNNVAIVHSFRDITMFTEHVIACDLQKSFSFHKTAEITSHARSRYDV